MSTQHFSKSRYCSCIQCPKILWLKEHLPEEFDDSVMNQAVLSTGNDVGDLAMGLFGDYTEIPFTEKLGNMIPFQKRWYYTKEMQGSYSIKYVLPALYPDEPSLNYHNLEGVHNGGEASNTFLAMQKMDKEELEKWREHLLRYCELDTFAMVKVLEKLQKAAK